MATFTNQATLSYNGLTRSSNVAVGEIVEILSMTKNALTSTYNVGDTVTYVVSLVNTGANPITDVTLTDNLGAYEVTGTTYTPLTYEGGTIQYYLDGVRQPTPTITAVAPLTVTGLTVPAQGNAQIIYQARVNEYAPLGVGRSVVNQARATSPTVTPITADATITTNDSADLGITKAISPNPVTENGTVTYTFVLTNNGPVAADAASNVVVADTFNPTLTNLSVSLNGTPLAPATGYNNDATTGDFSTVAGQITVPAATYTRDPITGVWTTTPGSTTLTVTGTI